MQSDIHELINYVWLSIRLNNLIDGHKTNWKKIDLFYSICRCSLNSKKSEALLKELKLIHAVESLYDALKQFTKLGDTWYRGYI